VVCDECILHALGLGVVTCRRIVSMHRRAQAAQHKTGFLWSSRVQRAVREPWCLTHQRCCDQVEAFVCRLVELQAPGRITGGGWVLSKCQPIATRLLGQLMATEGAFEGRHWLHRGW